MANRLADAISPYLRAHAVNPVDWWPWSAEAFAEAARRDVPVLVSIGYSTCHWCHVMARESFSDPDVAAIVNERFVAVKVDREEHPDVDASYLAAAAAFTSNLGWPLTVFATPSGRPFYAGTYFPPVPGPGGPSFRQLLDGVTEAWVERRGEVEDAASAVAGAIERTTPRSTEGALPGPGEIAAAVTRIAADEDRVHGGFGAAPKFPVAPALLFLLGENGGADLADRTLRLMGASPLRDPVEGGFFRYATRADWSEPHYERMLYDNALLLDAYTRAWLRGGAAWAEAAARGIARFLTGTLRLPSGGFASAQDSESVVRGARSEGGYYALDEEARAGEVPPALDEKVLAGWNGLAIGALARAGAAFADSSFLDAAQEAADHLLARHRGAGGALVRASLGGRVSAAPATLEDYGMLAGGLIELAVATGRVRYAVAARDLVDRTLSTGGPPRPPEGGDPVLEAQGLALDLDPSEGAYPSGLSAIASAALALFALTGERGYRDAAESALAPVGGVAVLHPASFGGSLEVLSWLAGELVQLVVVRGDAAGDTELIAAARRLPASVTAVVTGEQARAFADAGFELFEGRGAREGATTAYLCRNFVCRLPVTRAADLAP